MRIDRIFAIRDGPIDTGEHIMRSQAGHSSACAHETLPLGVPVS